MAKRNSHPKASSITVKHRMQAQPRLNTSCEMAIRRLLFSEGVRYRVHSRPISSLRREADIVFRKMKIAVFIDGCFWHGCPQHKKVIKTHRLWWERKISKTKERDMDTDEKLQSFGWTVIRIWEHENPEEAAGRILKALKTQNDQI